MERVARIELACKPWQGFRLPLHHTRVEIIYCLYSLLKFLAEAVRFELTEHRCSTVFKTVAINRTLPRFPYGGNDWNRTSPILPYEGSAQTIYATLPLFWWTNGGSNPDLRGANAACSHYHYQPMNSATDYLSHCTPSVKARFGAPGGIRTLRIGILNPARIPVPSPGHGCGF